MGENNANTGKVANSVIEVTPFQREGNTFQILNGNWLEGVPLQNPLNVIDNSFQLDQTGA